METYEIIINGIPHRVQLDKPPHKAVSETAKTPENKAVTPENKSKGGRKKRDGDSSDSDSD